MRRSSGVAIALAVLALLIVPTPSAAQGPTSPPGAPTSVTASPGTLSATVQWTPSGSAADSYTVTSNPGGVTATVDGTATQATVTGLGYLMSYTFTVTGTNALGTSPPSAASNSVTPGPPGGPYHQGFAFVLLNKNISAGSPLATNFGDDPVHLPGITGVVINVTASQATVSTDVQAVVNQVVVASVSVAPGQVQSSLEVFAVPAQLTQAALQVTAGTAHVELDFVGYFTGPNTVRDHSGQLTMIAPATLADSSVAADSTTNVAVLGQGGIPAAHVAAVLLNVTATNVAGTGGFTLIPTGGYALGITTLGFAAAQTTANRAIVAVPSNGSISVIDRGAAASVHIDVLGWVTDGTDPAALGALYNPLTPARLVDTAANGGPLAAGAIQTFLVYGQGGAPPVTATAPPTSAMVRITAVTPTGAGSIAVAGTTFLDFVAGQTASRNGIVHLANDGSVTFGVAGSATNVTVDLIAYFAGDLIVPGSTKVLTPALLASITTLGDDDSVTFAPGTPLSPFIRLNDVIVAGISPTTPQGFLLRVQSITAQSDGSILVGARRALLPEALTAFTIDWVYAPSGTRFGAGANGGTAMIVPSAAIASGNPFPPPPNSSINTNLPHLTLSDIIALANLVGGGGLVLGSDGALHFFPASWADLALTDLELQVLPYFHIEYNFFNNTANAVFNFSVGVKLAFELSVTKDLVDINHRLWSKTLPIGTSFDIQIGPVPVIVTPTITLALTFDASISVGLRFAYHFDKFMQTTVSYVGGQFSTSSLEKVYVNGFDPPAFFANAQAKVAVHAGPGLTFYRFCPAILARCINPFTVGVDANRFLSASSTVTCTPQPSCFPNPWWTLSMGQCIGVFMALDLFFVKKFFSQDLACTELVLLQAPGPHLNVTITPATATVPRFHVQHFHATVSNSQNGVSFSVDGGNANGTLSNTLLTTDADYTAPGTPGDYRLVAASIEDPSSVALAQIHVPADPPTVPTSVGAVLAGITSVTVTWGVPADTGGVPITDYKVVSSDGTTIDAGTSTSATFTGLIPGTTYTFSVYATNSANLTSAAAISPSVTLPPPTPVTVQPPSVDFGIVTLGQVTGPQTVTVYASNAKSLTIFTVTLGGTRPQDYTIQSDLCSLQVVPAGGSCTFAVVFTGNVQGPSTATAFINDDDLNSPQSVSITGQVSTGAVVAACFTNTIAGGQYHTAVVDPTGKVFTWGRNEFGQLGNGSLQGSGFPVAVSTSTGLPQAAEVSAGCCDTFVRTVSGTVWALGSNLSGALGNTAVQGLSTVPVQVMDVGGVGYLTGVSDVAGGGFPFAVAVKSADGSVWSWGENVEGQLGNSTTTSSPTPVQVLGPGGVGYLTGVVKVAAGTRHVVALKSDGTVWAWGRNSIGELGDNATSAMETTPVQVTGPNGVGFLTGIIAIGTEGDHTLAVRADGTVFAWGNNVYGQLGIGTTTPSFVPYPVAVSTISGLTKNPSVSTGEEHSLAADPITGKAWGWGWNPYGQVGDGTQTGDLLTPSQVAAPVSFTEVAGGTWHSIGLGSDGSVWTWGYNYFGELGNGQMFLTINPIPHAVSGVTAAQPQSC